MKTQKISILIITCIFCYNLHGFRLYSQPDSIPPPPPPQAMIVNGPLQACTGDTCIYEADVPVACICQWTVNGEIQPDTVSPLVKVYSTDGLKTVTLAFVSNGQTSIPDTAFTEVSETPSQPAPISGPDTVCEYTTHTYTTIAGPFDTCQWTVNGVIQSATGPSLTYSFGGQGNYLIEVFSFNQCGTGSPVFENVPALSHPAVFLGNDTTILQGQTLLLDAGNPGSEYLWSTGSTEQTLLVSVAGTYWVNVTNICGTGYDEIVVSVIVNVGEDNPADDFRVVSRNGRLHLIHPPGNIRSMAVYSMSGGCVYRGMGPDEMTLFNRGLYIVRIVTDRQVFSRKVIIH
ncbi:MAG: T9SS type A sorting domain-containing protein [Bacteroidales bacterium]